MTAGRPRGIGADQLRRRCLRRRSDLGNGNAFCNDAICASTVAITARARQFPRPDPAAPRNRSPAARARYGSAYTLATSVGERMSLLTRAGVQRAALESLEIIFAEPARRRQPSHPHPPIPPARVLVAIFGSGTASSAEAVRRSGRSAWSRRSGVASAVSSRAMRSRAASRRSEHTAADLRRDTDLGRLDVAGGAKPGVLSPASASGHAQRDYQPQEARRAAALLSLRHRIR
jgi:hypothetical protein